MKGLITKPLTVAVLSILGAQVALAQDNTQASTPTVELAPMKIGIDRQGAKVKTNVVTLKKKDESTATGLRELLKSEPAIDFGSGNGASQYISIRGMGQNSVDVKVDNAYSDSQILYHQGRHMLDPSLVKIVSVQKGAGSASAGIGATNGAIVAKTVDAHDLLKDGKNYGFKLGTIYSSNDELSYNATAYGKVNNFDFLVSANKVDQDNYKGGKGYTNYLGGDTVPSTDVDKVNYLAKVGANFGDHRFVLSHLNMTDKGVRNVREEFDIRPANEAGGRLSVARQDPHYRELSLTQTNLEWTGKNLGFADDVTANIYTMENKRESAGGEQYGNPGIRGVTLADNETKVKTKGANINFDSYINSDFLSKYKIDTLLLKYGANYRHQESIPNYLRKATDLVNVAGRGQPANWQPFGVNLNHQEKTDTGLYVESIADIGNVTATVGLRYDHFKFKAMDGKEVSDGDINPSIGLIWQATPSLSFNANHNHATRSPRMYDALRSGALVSIADDVKAEKAKNTEIGFNYKQSTQYGNFGIDGSYYWQKIDDLLTSGQVSRHDETGAVAYYNGIDNVGYAKNKGWELGANYNYQNITARLGVAESNPEFYSMPDAQGNLPSFGNREYAVNLGRTYTAGLSYRFDNPNLEVGVNHRRTAKSTGEVWKNNPAYNANAVRDGYDTTDVYANWKPYGNDKMNVNFAINNISDEYYVPQTLSGVGLPGVGREYRIGVNFTY
ncbi:TonB-dependent siderophore receptor [Moraxella oblonga]|uniref:TonB-dependent siderophore receptor n=1 Tax=Moraxella oblonga TaxID=200413 RepID=UPI0008300C0E|nr:TonB-dependent siderophore receptor [Moraxella oblonga]